MKRGLVIPSSTVVVDSGDSSTIGGSIPPEIIRHWLLFWDEFCCPGNPIVAGLGTPELVTLQSLGLLQEIFVQFPGGVKVSSGDFSSVILASQHSAHAHLNKNEPGKWTIGSNEEIVSTGLRPDFETALVFELINAFQIPDQSTPLEDILEFKEKRRDELIAFHIHIEEIYARIIASRDILRSKTVELVKLEKSLADYNAVVDERFGRKVLRSLQVVMDRSLIESVGLGMAGASLAPSIELPSLPFGLFTAGAAFTLRNVLSPRSKAAAHPLTYISSSQRLQR